METPTESTPPHEPDDLAAAAAFSATSSAESATASAASSVSAAAAAEEGVAALGLSREFVDAVKDLSNNFARSVRYRLLLVAFSAWTAISFTVGVVLLVVFLTGQSHQTAKIAEGQRIQLVNQAANGLILKDAEETLKQVQSVTSDGAKAAAAQSSAQVIDHVILCVQNHGDIRANPKLKVLPGCPTAPKIPA